MKRFALALLLVLALAAPARAFDPIYARNVCISKEVMARILCKQRDEFNFVRMRDQDVYEFYVFYANKPTIFYTTVQDGLVVVQGHTKPALIRTLPFRQNFETNCATVDFPSDGCARRPPSTCCPPETRDDVMREKEKDFWNKPVPELLNEDYRRLTGKNATEEGRTGDPKPFFFLLEQDNGTTPSAPRPAPQAPAKGQKGAK